MSDGYKISSDTISCNYIVSFNYIPNTNKALIFGINGDIYSIDIMTNDIAKYGTYEFYKKTSDCRMRFFPNCNLAICQTENYSLMIYNISTHKKSIICMNHTDIIMSIYVSQCGNIIITGSADKTIKIWNSGSLTSLTLIGNPFFNSASKKYDSEYPGCVVMTANNKYLISGHSHGSLFVWNFEINSIITQFIGHDFEITCISLSKDEKRILTGSGDDTIKMWDFDTGNLIMNINGHRHYMINLQFTADEKYIVSNSPDDTIRFWDSETGVEVRKFNAFGDWLVIPEDYRTIAYGRFNGIFILRNISNNTKHKTKLLKPKKEHLD